MAEKDPAPPSSPTGALLRMEGEVRAFWEREGIAARALSRPATGRLVRWAEGPPTANGLPHLGSLLPRVLKDAFLRFHRMQGHRIETARGGWDCHGLPVEVEVEKSHHWTTKKQIVEFGVAAFVEECRRSVRKYEGAWREFSERIAFWLDFDHAYFTMSPEYIESVWWSLKTLYGRGLLEKGHYVVPYCARCETSLSFHELNQEYHDATDPSITVRLELVEPLLPGRRSYLWVWTTTPWTLPANLAVAVSPELEYVVVEGEAGALEVLAEPALARYFPEPATRPTVVRHLAGRELVGRRYSPPFPGLAPESEKRHRVYAGDFVGAEEGTGMVHVAPAFGADDYKLGEREGLGVFDPLEPGGRFSREVPLVAGKWFKDADPLLTEDLSRRGLLVRAEKLEHSYPFCWRCGRPLMYRALDSWFVRTHELTGRLLAHNETIHWTPEHLRDGRFGNFVREGRDWALSRSRYWGTPLPVWRCPRGHWEVVGSFSELERLAGGPLPEGFDPHRPYLDELPVRCPEHGEALAREPYVIDVWYDSGSAPFAQYHWPFAPGTGGEAPVPLEFVAEGIDQTRGWFYTLHVLAGALFDEPGFRHAVVNEFALDDRGMKMSKSKGNAEDPVGLVSRLGADPVRFGIYLTRYTEPARITETTLRQTGVRQLTTLLNVLEFYRTNAELDRVTAPTSRPTVSSALDRWLLSRVSSVSREVTRALEGYDAHEAAEVLSGLIEDLSVWWLRRSRPRFWMEGSPPEKREAYAALGYALLELSHLLAPFVPHAAEHLYRTLHHGGEPPVASVHLAAWPTSTGAPDPRLEEAMSGLRGMVESARSLRMEAGVKARIPLEELRISGAAVAGVRELLGADFEALLEGELNVKRVTVVDPEGISPPTPPEWLVRREGGLSLALPREPSRELRLEGLAREVLRRVQAERKKLKLRFDQKVHLELWAEGDGLEALRAHRGWLAGEAQATQLELHGSPPPPGTGPLETVDEPKLSFRLVPVP